MLVKMGNDFVNLITKITSFANKVGFKPTTLCPTSDT